MELTKEERDGVKKYIEQISQRYIMIPVDKNTTNGEIIEKLFPDLKVVRGKGNLQINRTKGNIVSSTCMFSDWWDEEFANY